MLELVLLILAVILGTLLVTLLLCRLTRNRFKPLRSLPLLGVAALWAQAWYDYTSGGFFGDLAAFVDFIASLLVLLGWAVALVLVFLKRRKRKCPKEENSGSSAF